MLLYEISTEATKSMSSKTQSQFLLTRLVQIATLWEESESHKTNKYRRINAHFLCPLSCGLLLYGIVVGGTKFIISRPQNRLLFTRLVRIAILSARAGAWNSVQFHPKCRLFSTPLERIATLRDPHGSPKDYFF